MERVQILLAVSIARARVFRREGLPLEVKQTPTVQGPKREAVKKSFLLGSVRNRRQYLKLVLSNDLHLLRLLPLPQCPNRLHLLHLLQVLVYHHPHHHLEIFPHLLLQAKQPCQHFPHLHLLFNQPKHLLLHLRPSALQVCRQLHGPHLHPFTLESGKKTTENEDQH